MYKCSYISYVPKACYAPGSELFISWVCTHMHIYVGCETFCLLLYRSVCVGVRCCSKYFWRVIRLQHDYAAILLWCPGFKHWFHIKERSRGTKCLSQFTKGFSLSLCFSAETWWSRMGGNKAARRDWHTLSGQMCAQMWLWCRELVAVSYRQWNLAQATTEFNFFSLHICQVKLGQHELQL